MYTVPYLRTQSQLLDFVARRSRDGGNRRWSREEVVGAINDAVGTWANRVSVPHVYTIVGGWKAGQYEYTLPDYINATLQPQRRILAPFTSGDGTPANQYVWDDILGWSVEPDGSGGQVLRLQYNEGVRNTENTGRILWWAENGRLPETDDGEDPTLNANIDADDTELTLASSVEVGRSGYVKIGSEFMAYAGTSDDGTNTTLQNLSRGVNSTAASHAQNDAVQFCVAAPNTKLWDVLRMQARANLSELPLVEAPGDEIEHHQWNLRWHSQEIEKFWEAWVPRSPKIKMGRRASGWRQQEYR